MALITREERELAHDKKILENSDKVWGREGLAGQNRLLRRVKMINDFCGLNNTKRVLEIGCGTGSLTKNLAQTGASVVATDLFSEFLELARKNSGSPANVEFKTADAQTLADFPDQSFDAVCGLSILHHLDIKKTLANIFRVLKTGGVMAFSEPNMLNPQIAVQKNVPIIKKWLGDSPDETAFFKWQMKKLLAAAGFKEITVTPFDFLHPSLPDFTVNVMIKVGNALEKIPALKEIAGSLFIGAKKL